LNTLLAVHVTRDKRNTWHVTSGARDT
jgi:hypothetical protein